MAFYNTYGQERATKKLHYLLMTGNVDVILSFIRENAENIVLDDLVNELAKEGKGGSLLQRLLDQGLDPVLPIGPEHLPLFHVFIALHGSNGPFRPKVLLDMVNLFLRHGANINYPDTYHRTLLHTLYDSNLGMHTKGGREILEELIALGADLDLQDDRGLTPVHYMMYLATDSSSLIKTLEIAMAHGFNPMIETNEGKTVRAFAEELQGDSDEVLAVLESYEADWLARHPVNRMSGQNMLEAAWAREDARRGGRRLRKSRKAQGRLGRKSKGRKTRRH
jgi:hypothetical protein